MKIVFLTLVVLIMISCNSKNFIEPSFDLIDVSMYNGWTDYYCLKILSNGKTYVFNHRHRKGEKYYAMTIGKIELDSISKMAEIILNSSLDTVYKRNCHDCSTYNLIIKTKVKTFKSFVDGVDYANSKIECMNNLIQYLYMIGETSRNKLDSVFIFESRTNYFYPPPIPPGYQNNDYTEINILDTIK